MNIRDFSWFLLFFISCIVFFSSCKQKWDYTREIMQLDSTSSLWVSAEKNLLAIDTGYFRASYNSTAQYLRSIKERCFNDTVQKNTAIFLSDIYKCSENIYYLLDSNSFEKIINGSKQRINDLKHDLAQNIIDKDKAKEYVAYELKVAQKTAESIVLAIEKAKLSCVKLDSMKTQIIELDSLKLK